MINGQDIGGYGFRLSGGRAITQASNTKSSKNYTSWYMEIYRKNCAYRSTNAPDMQDHLSAA